METTNEVLIGYNEYGSLKTFFVITMKLKNGKKLYLQHEKDIIKNKKWVGDICKWVAYKSEALYFDTFKNAEDYAKNYFKNFKDYSIESFNEIW